MKLFNRENAGTIFAKHMADLDMKAEITKAATERTVEHLFVHDWLTNRGLIGMRDNELFQLANLAQQITQDNSSGATLLYDLVGTTIQNIQVLMANFGAHLTVQVGQALRYSHTDHVLPANYPPDPKYPDGIPVYVTGSGAEMNGRIIRQPIVTCELRENLLPLIKYRALATDKIQQINTSTLSDADNALLREYSTQRPRSPELYQQLLATFGIFLDDIYQQWQQPGSTVSILPGGIFMTTPKAK